jgi:hypothetical protein
LTFCRALSRFIKEGRKEGRKEANKPQKGAKIMKISPQLQSEIEQLPREYE